MTGPAGRGIYLAGSISGGRQFATHLPLIASAIEAAGYVVLSKPVLDPGADLETQTLGKCRAIFERDVAWIEESAAMIAEVSAPSLGVGYEIREALCRGKPVLCLRHESLEDAVRPAMIWGNTSPLISFEFYGGEDVGRVVGAFLAGLGRAP
jgi:nucleoside 2-deoxyribosyltransferase